MRGSSSLKACISASLIVVSTAVSAWAETSSVNTDRIMLWSWFNADETCQSTPDDIDYGLAVLRGRVIAGDTIDEIATVPRLARVKHTSVNDMAVVRLEIRPDRLAMDATRQDDYIDRLVQKTLTLALGSRPIRCLQIDCDARLSQRDLYIRYLRALRKRLPAQIDLSITALASWAFGDRWIQKANLPVCEVVPMYFSMGKSGEQIRQLIASGRKPETFGRDERVAGLRYQELTDFVVLAHKADLEFDRIYLFSSDGWSPQKSLEAIKLVLPLLSRKKPQ